MGLPFIFGACRLLTGRRYIGAFLYEQTFDLDVAIDILGGDGEGVLFAKQLALEVDTCPLHVAVGVDAVAREVVAVLDDDA